MVPSAAESVPLPWSVTVAKWEDPRKSALPLGSPQYLLHTCVASIQNGDPQLQSLNHHGAHLTCRGEIRLNHQGKRVNHACWALPGLFNQDFIAQCEPSVGVPGARPETTETTFAGADHLKDHLRRSPLVQPSLLVQGFLLFHLFFLENVQGEFTVVRWVERDNLYLPKEGDPQRKFQKFIFRCYSASQTVHPQFTPNFMPNFPLFIAEATQSIPLWYQNYRKWPQIKMCLFSALSYKETCWDWNIPVRLSRALLSGMCRPQLTETLPDVGHWTVKALQNCAYTHVVLLLLLCL